MALDNYISALLYKHDCVIVPGLGGFIGNHKPAQINPIQNTFSPPSKSISFNKNLVTNDGLLANYVAQKESISYPNACKNIERSVLQMNGNLRNGTRVVLKGIGVLSLDKNSRLNFEPEDNINYLLDAHGLTVFQKQPIKRATIEEKVAKEFKDRTAPLTAVKEGNKKSKKWMAAAAITIPLAFFAIWIPSKYDLSGDLNMATFNPLKATEKAIYVPNNSAIEISEEPIESLVKEQIAIATENSYFLDIKLDEADYTVKLKELDVASAVSTYVASANENFHYHIVAGCFSSKRNARKMVKKLTKDGFSASIIGKRKGLWTVSYSSFVTRKEAVTFLATAKDHNSKAWVLNY